MCRIAVQIPEEVLYDIKMTEEQANDFAKRSIAMMLYTQNHISIGYSAQIAGMTEEEFIKYLSSNGVSIFNFDDYMTLIDSNWNRIEALRIVGDLDLTIPVNELERLKFIHDKNKNEIGQIVLINKFDKKEIRFNLKRNKNLPR